MYISRGKRRENTHITVNCTSEGVQFGTDVYALSSAVRETVSEESERT